MPLAALVPGEDESLGSALERELALQAAKFPEILGYRVADAAGRLRYFSQSGLPPIEASDREYFVELRNDSPRSLVFSQVLTGRISGNTMLIIAVPVRDPAGVFRGVVMAPLDLGQLQRMFEAVNLGPNGVITLRRSDNGRLALCRPARPATVNQTLSNNPLHQRIEAGDQFGSIRFHAALDGIERLYAYRRIGDYPFYVAFGSARARRVIACWPTSVTM